MDKIYINLTKNPDWKSPADKVPVYIGPKNMKHPDKNWTVGVTTIPAALASSGSSWISIST